MDFSYSEEQIMLQKMAREFLEKECTEKIVREIQAGDVGYSPEQWKKIADLGWLGFLYPENCGGMNGTILDMAVVYEEMGRTMFPSPHLATVILSGMTILNGGTEEQKKEYLTKIACGDLIMALSLNEPESSWDGKAWEAEGVTMKATAQGDNYVLDGTKLFVEFAKVADYMLVATRTRNTGKAENGITLFLVDAKSPGITANLLVTTGGDKQCEVVFKNVKVPKANMIGKLNAGWQPLEKAMKLGAVLLSAQMVGADRKVLELAVDYAKTRTQFEVPIGVWQYVQEHCVMILTELDSSWWLTYDAAWKLSQGQPADMEVALAKGWCSDSHERACWRAHQVYGGVGYTILDGVMPLYSKRGKYLQQYLGDSDYHKRKIANALDKWPVPPQPKGKALHLWEGVEEQRIPDWFDRFSKGAGMSATKI